MKFGILADYFKGAGAKYLSEVEVNKLKSNQHEFQGVSGFRRFLGEPADKKRFDATFYWLDDEASEPFSLASFCTWSDVRRDNPKRAAEYHLYYSADSEPVVHQARAGNLLVIAKTKHDTLLVMLCPADTTIARQLLWLFGLDLLANAVDAKALKPEDSVRLGFAARAVLDDLGIELEEAEPDALGRLMETFGLQFPPTADLSAFARDTLGETDPVGAPDETLVAWMDHEEALFRHLERHVVSDRLAGGFMSEDGTADVDGFLSFSLSVQNRRKSRAGWAFGHHVEAILAANDVCYKREATTEKRNGPDFLFPGEDEYHDPNFRAELLTMLGAKTSCKDRWRQVLAEAHRISKKHLLTLQPGISAAQTAEMQAEQLQLVVPRPIFTSYLPAQQAWLMDVRNFIELVKGRQT